jgi:hypothetical protein
MMSARALLFGAIVVVLVLMLLAGCAVVSGPCAVHSGDTGAIACEQGGRILVIGPSALAHELRPRPGR